VASDRSRPDRVIGAFAAIDLSGPGTGQTDLLPVEDVDTFDSPVGETMARDESLPCSATRSGRDWSDTTRCDRWEKLKAKRWHLPGLVHQSTLTLQVASGFARGRVRGDGSRQGLTVRYVLERFHHWLGQLICTAILDGTRAPPSQKQAKGDSPRFRPRARPLATRPPATQSTPRSTVSVSSVSLW